MARQRVERAVRIEKDMVDEMFLIQKAGKGKEKVGRYLSGGRGGEVASDDGGTANVRVFSFFDKVSEI